MKFSVIIPVYNAQDTLRYCLDSIFSSENKDFEVIAVDAKSTDRSAEIAKRYPCRLITLEENKGAAFPRNRGRDEAKGQILLFIDDDITIKKESLELIDKSFKEDKDIVAVTGLLSRECPHKDFFTQYKNLYMHHIFKKCPRYVDFLYGSLMAIKKDDFLRLNESFKMMEDTELGQRYKKLNRKILLNQALEVVHFKRYDFKSLLKNDFSVPFWCAKSFILYNGYKDIFKKGRFSHVRLSQVISVAVSFLLTISLICWRQPEAKIAFSILVILFFLLNYSFFAFLYRERGIIFSIKSAIFTGLDTLIMGCGALAGLVWFKGLGLVWKAKI